MIEVVGALPPADRRSAFANAPMGVALTTPDGVLVDANPALCAMLGAHRRGAARPVGPRPGPPRGVAAAPRGLRSRWWPRPSRPMRHETRLRARRRQRRPGAGHRVVGARRRRRASPPTW